jgi:cell division protein FtsX
MKIVFWLFSALQTLPGTICAALGVGWLTSQGLKFALDGIASQVLDSANSLPSDLYGVLSLAGFIDFIGIILGCIAAKSILLTADKFTRISGR